MKYHSFNEMETCENLAAQWRPTANEGYSKVKDRIAALDLFDGYWSLCISSSP